MKAGDRFREVYWPRLDREGVLVLTKLDTSSAPDNPTWLATLDGKPWRVNEYAIRSFYEPLPATTEGEDG